MKADNKIQKNEIKLVYELKPDTKTSYYLKEGSANIFPNRICISNHKFAYTKSDLRKDLFVGTLNATFRKSEVSEYKKLPPYQIHSGIYSPAKFKGIYYADLATSGLNGKCSNRTQDLVVFSDAPDSVKIELRVFKDMLFEKEKVFQYVTNHTD